ncbi:MAG: hypothetical protein GY847_28945 [Proteobacteria bacterium]|nr:hypothetical protein [Pseudomonadota bacterium]
MGDYLCPDGSVAQPVILMMQTGDGDGNAVFLGSDSSTNAINVIDYAHHEIHGGSAFACHYTQTVSDTDDRSIIAFKTADSLKYCHLVFTASASEPATASIIEAPTITDNAGATLAVYNRRRVGTPTVTTVIDTSQNPDTAGSAMYFTETTMGSVTSGTVLDTIPLVSGTGNRAVGGSSRGNSEWILKPDTLYAFEVISLDDSNNTHRLQVDWYEHTDKG